MWKETIINAIPFLIHETSRLSAYLYLLVFLIACVDSIPFLGFFLPVTVPLILAGFIASQSGVSIWWLVLWAGIGGSIGYGIAYYAGCLGYRFFEKEKFFFKKNNIKIATTFFKKYGSKSVLFGRFFEPVRIFVPLVAGFFNMKESTFWLQNVLGGFIWSSTLLLAGYWFDSRIANALLKTNSYEVFAWVIFAFFVFLIGGYWWVGKKAGSFDETDFSTQHITEQPKNPNQQ